MKHITPFRLFEYMNNDRAYALYKYLQADEDYHKQELPHTFYEKYEEFLEEEDIEDEDYDIYDDDFVEYEYMYKLKKSNPELYSQFAEWLFDKVQDHSLDIDDTEYPTWSYMDFREMLKPNTWMVHFTQQNIAHSIATQGFTKGVADISKLGLTNYLSSYDKSFAGYNFAYRLDDARRYNPRLQKYGDGDAAVLVRSAGVRVYHYSDEDYQSIFSGEDVSDIVVLTKDTYDDKWVIYNQERLVRKDDFYDLVDWVVKHYDQYRGKLSRRK